MCVEYQRELQQPSSYKHFIGGEIVTLEKNCNLWMRLVKGAIKAEM